MPNGHDQLFKDLIRSFPGDFLRLAAPALAARLDLGSLEFQAAEGFTDLPHGARRHPDLISPARTRAESTGSVLLHVEIELRFRSTVPFRLFRYNRLLQLRHDLPVHSLVLYLHGGPPGACQNFYREVSLAQEVVRFRYRSLGLSRAPAEEYLARPQPLAWALAALMRSRLGAVEHRRACLRRIAAARQLDEARRFLLFNCVATYLEWGGEGADELAPLLAGRPKEESAMMTWEEKTEVKGMRKLLLEQLKERFHTLPPEIPRRLSAITSPKELGRLARQILSARSLEELGLV